MKKASHSTARQDTLRREYDFSGGVRGKHYRAMQGGYTITVRHDDGSTVIKEVKPKEGAVTLAPDVREYLTDSESVNAALRSLIGLIPKKRGTVAKRTRDHQGRSPAQ